jgi:hypothetical protein
MSYRMYIMYGVRLKKKQKGKRGVYWGLVDKISPAFELRNSGVPAVARSQVIPAIP